jgi:hypothetical protein
MGVIITCVIVASVATPLLSGIVALMERYLKCLRKAYIDEHAYVELPRQTKTPLTDKDLPQTRSTFLNKTLYEASACNCPILCELLIEKGATELEAALEVAIINGHYGICKLIITNTAITIAVLHKALKTARALKKGKIVILIEEQLQAA